tara:strand:+ start:479 stop:931 length:453 start_codon:yes stop_codon:yes gene_type:complete
MKTFKDFNSISPYSPSINNQKWNFSFMASKIICSIDDDYTIYNTRVLCRDVGDFNTYEECFKDLLNEINQLELCISCKRYDKDGCKKCKVNKIIDDLGTTIEGDCPICYNKLTIRHISVCSDDRHLLCDNCYNAVINKSNKCPLCRKVGL